MQTQPPPLMRYNSVNTRSPDEAREEIGRIFCPHFLSPTTARANGFHAVHNSAQFNDFSLNYVAYGASVEIDPGELSKFYLLQIPVKGRANVRCGTVAVDAGAAHAASVLSPTLPTRMIWHEGCEKIIVLIRRDAMINQFSALTHQRSDRLEFQTGIDLSSAVGRTVHKHVGLMLEAAEDLDETGPSYHVALRDSLMTLMLTGLQHSHATSFSSAPLTPAPHAVRRAEDFIAQNCDQPISMVDVAAAAGTCLRSLQDGFKRHHGITLTECLQKHRMERFRLGLERADDSATVSDIALQSGFGHLGRAAAAYRAFYGETPSATLRKSLAKQGRLLSFRPQ